MTKDEKRQQALIERAHAVLSETGQPFVIFFPSLGFVRVSDVERNFVLIEEGSQTIYTNVAKRYACAIVEDMAEMLATVRIKTLESNIERSLDQEDWGGDGTDKK